MKLSEYALVAEIVAAVCVVISLIFVGIQLSEANEEARAATVQASTDSELRVLELLINHAGTWDKVIAGNDFSDDAEKRRALLMYNALMLESENRFHQYTSGYMDADVWRSRFATLRPLTQLSIYQDWRQSLGGQTHGPDFLEMLDSLKEESAQ